MSNPSSKVHRLLQMIYLIQRREAGNARELAGQLGVSERSLYRYLETLTSLGIPCYFDSDVSEYRIRRDYYLPPVQLTPEEALALTALTGEIAQREQIAMTAPAARALEKIRGQLPPRVLADLEIIEKYITIQLPPTGPAGAGIDDVYARIKQAIREKRALHCTYESLSQPEGSKAFLFEPYLLNFDQRAWYTIGWHRGREALRCLKLVRFTGMELTQVHYELPADFSIDSFRGDAWRMIRGQDRHQVTIQFDARMAETVQDTHWHRTQSTEDLADGSLLFHCEVEGLDEIVWWVMGYGPHARVLKPAVLANRVAEMARTTAALYAKEDKANRIEPSSSPMKSAST